MGKYGDIFLPYLPCVFSDNKMLKEYFDILLLLKGLGDIMKLSKLFSDYAVFQRNKPIRIWGEGKGKVSATINGHTAHTVCRNGVWKLSLPPMDAGGPYDLIIKDSEEQIILSDICIGDVWLAAGQSNMEHITLGTYDGFKDAESLGDNPNIRFFTVPRKTRRSDTNCNWHFETVFPIDTPWQVCTPEAALHFSAIGFRFAAYLEKNKNIPVGIISVNYGGTPAEAWIEENAFFEDARFDPLKENYFNILSGLDLEQYTNLVDSYQKIKGDLIENIDAKKIVEEYGVEETARKSPADFPPDPPLGPYSARWVGVLYENMIKPILPYSVCGVLWYQGESNVNNRQYYFDLFSKLIQCWRKGFDDNLPFFTVQIAPFGYAYKEGCTGLVLQQIKAAKEIENVYFVTTNDIGENCNIHPLNKKSVAERLFLAALNVVYGENVEYCGPVFKSAVLEDENIVRVSFTHSDSGLICKGGIQNLYLRGSSGEYVAANSRIDGSDLLVWADEISHPVEVKMAYDNTDIITLYNKEGFVAAPFYSTVLSE